MSTHELKSATDTDKTKTKKITLSSSANAITEKVSSFIYPSSTTTIICESHQNNNNTNQTANSSSNNSTNYKARLLQFGSFTNKLYRFTNKK